MKYFSYISLLLIASCASMRKVERTSLKYSDFNLEQRNRAELIRNLEGTFFLDTVLEGKKIAAKSKIYLANLNLFRIEFHDPLGRLQLLMIKNQQKFWVFIPEQKVVYLDETGGLSYLKKYMNWKMKMEVFVAYWFGLVPKTETWSWDEKSGVFKSEKAELVLSIDKDKGFVRRVKSNDKENYEIIYEDFSPLTEGLRLGNSVKMDAANSALSLEWENIEMNKPYNLKSPLFHFVPPAGVQLLNLKGLN